MLYLPAEQLTIKQLADKSAVEQLSGWLQIIHQGAKLVGPAAGGALLAITDPSGAFLVSAGLFLLAFVLISLERPQLAAATEPSSGDGDSEGHSLWHGLAEGARFALTRYPLNLALILVSTALMIIFLYDNFIPLMVKNVGYDTKAFGLTISLVGLGGMIGGYLAIKLAERYSPLKVIPTAICLSGPMMIYFGLCEMGSIPVYQPLFLLTWFAVGVVTSIALVPFNIYVVKVVPKAKLGTVTGLNESIQTLGAIAGPIMGAAIVERFGVGAVFILGGLLSLSIALIGFTALTISPPPGPDGAPASDQEPPTFSRATIAC